MEEKVLTSFGFGQNYFLKLAVTINPINNLSHSILFSDFSKVKAKGRDRAELRMDQVKVHIIIEAHVTSPSAESQTVTLHLGMSRDSQSLTISSFDSVNKLIFS